MTSLRWVSIKLTIFTLVTVFVTVWLATIIGNFKLFAEPYVIEAEFTDASGLLAVDVVKAAGVTVGRVQEIKVVDGLAIVKMSIDEEIQLPAGVGAQIRFRNLIGQRMITLVERRDSPLTGSLGDGDRIPMARTAPAFDLTVLFNGLRPLIRSTNPRDINIVSKALVEGLEGRSDEVERILGNIAGISDTLASRDQELSALLDNLNIITSDIAGRDVQLRRTLANLQNFLGDIQSSKSELSDALITLDRASRLLERVVNTNSTRITTELADISTVLDAVNDKRRDLRGVIRALPEMLAAVERVSSYREWANIHMINVCKDDLGTCGTRRLP